MLHILFYIRHTDITDRPLNLLTGRSAHLADRTLRSWDGTSCPEICNLYHDDIDVNSFVCLKDAFHSCHVNTGADVICIAKKCGEEDPRHFFGQDCDVR